MLFWSRVYGTFFRPGLLMQTPEWLTVERRIHPSVEEQVGLIHKQIADTAARVEINRRLAERSNTELQETITELKMLSERFERFEAATTELVESYRFSRKMRKWLFGTIAGGLTFVAILTEGDKLAEVLEKWLR